MTPGGAVVDVVAVLGAALLTTGGVKGGNCGGPWLKKNGGNGGGPNIGGTMIEGGGGMLGSGIWPGSRLKKLLLNSGRAPGRPGTAG